MRSVCTVEGTVAGRYVVLVPTLNVHDFPFNTNWSAVPTAISSASRSNLISELIKIMDHQNLFLLKARWRAQPQSPSRFIFRMPNIR